MESTYCSLRKQNVWGVVGSEREWQKLMLEEHTWVKYKKSYVIC